MSALSGLFPLLRFVVEVEVVGGEGREAVEWGAVMPSGVDILHTSSGGGHERALGLAKGKSRGCDSPCCYCRLLRYLNHS